MKDINTMIQDKRLLYTITVHKDPTAYGIVYDKYIEPIYRFVSFKVSSPEEAQDITSEVFLKVWQHLISENGKKTQHIRGLLYQTARNTIIDTYRQKARRPSTSLEEAGAIPETTDIKEKISIDQEYQHLVTSMKQLKQEYQEVLLLRYIEQMSISEIANILEKKKSAVRVLIHRAVKKLSSIHNTPKS